MQRQRAAHHFVVLLLVIALAGCEGTSNSLAFWEVSDSIETPPVLAELWGDDTSTTIVQELGSQPDVFGSWIGRRDEQPELSFCLIVAGYLEPISEDVIAGTSCTTKVIYEDRGALVSVSTSETVLVSLVFSPSFAGKGFELTPGRVDLGDIEVLDRSANHLVLRFPVTSGPGAAFVIECFECDEQVTIP